MSPYVNLAKVLRKLGSEGEAASAAAVREWVERKFTILYIVTPEKIFLVNLKHHRQLGY